MENAENCSQSQKIVTNSVYCNLLEQYVSIHYCENGCRNFSNREKNQPKPTFQEQKNNIQIIDENEENIPDADDSGALTI
jgi:hypothetical protein